MDPSALIFIALAVAWAVYLIPKALEHHEESVRTRTVEKFSATMRVLASREPISRRRARLVRTPSPSSEPKAVSTSVAATVPASPDATPARPTVGRPALSARRSAARRRRRVVSVILLAVVLTALLAVVHVVAWAWVVLPLVVLGAWLVACRLMVKQERRGARPARGRAPQTGVTSTPATPPTPQPADAAVEDVDETGSISVVPASSGASDGRPDPTDPQSWDPVPVTLPTYVSKPVAPRSVRTIDLDSTGVWTSGRSESDSDLVRENEARQTKRRSASTEVSQRRRRA